MKDLIVLLSSLYLKIYFFGRIYLFWINRIRPALQNHYLMAKSDVALMQRYFYTTKSKVTLLQKHFYTTQSKIALLRKHFFITKSNVEHLQKHFYTTKSLFAALPGYIFSSMWNSTFLQRNFPVSMRYIFKGKLDRSRQ